MPLIKLRFVRLLFAFAAVLGSWAAQAGYTFTSIDYPGVPFIEVFGVNNSGQVVGFSVVSFVYDSKTGAFTTVPDDPDYLGTAVLGITEAGVMSGIVISDDFAELGFVRSKKGTFTVFSKPGWDNTEVRGISNTGLVTGYAFDNAFSMTVRRAGSRSDEFQTTGAS
jgi:hypothetical protein